MLVENPLFELALNAVLGFFHSKRILRRCQTRALDTHRLGLCLKEFGTCITFVPQPLGANQLWHLEFLTGTTIRMSFFVIIYRDGGGKLGIPGDRQGRTGSNARIVSETERVSVNLHRRKVDCLVTGRNCSTLVKRLLLGLDLETALSCRLFFRQGIAAVAP